MQFHDAIDRVCADVGIRVPSDLREGRWIKTDTLSGRNGKGDGRLIIDDQRVTAWNWQTGEKATVHLRQDAPVNRRKIAARIEKDREEKRRRAERAVAIASRLGERASLTPHPYLARKGFAAERVMTVGADEVAEIAGDYLVTAGARRAILLSARVGQRVTSAQLIWEDGTKKFLAGGEMGGAALRIAPGASVWLCEGFATGLSLRMVLRAMNRRDGVLCCFSASNIAAVAKSIGGRAWIAADHDRPLPQFGGLGAGEHYAKGAGLPYAMPPTLGEDINDMHQLSGLFAVQRLLSETIRGATR